MGINILWSLGLMCPFDQITVEALNLNQLCIGLEVWLVQNFQGVFLKWQVFFFYNGAKKLLCIKYIQQMIFVLITLLYNKLKINKFMFKNFWKHWDSRFLPIFWFNRLPLFLLQGCQFKELFLTHKGLIVKIGNFVFYKNCSFEKNIFF